MGSLDGRRILITGASAGIGEATAEAIVAAGGAVALGARRKDRLDDLAARLEGDGGTAVAIEADIGDETQANELVAKAADELGGLDGLVNNAGVMLLGLIQGADTDEWRRMIDVNLWASSTAPTPRCRSFAMAGEGTSSTSHPSRAESRGWARASTT